uniref:Uncharacterized protein n=1 Tax=Rhizophora mucronata TaxID=61149 RepID=A0A2P2N0K7_RHIMU
MFSIFLRCVTFSLLHFLFILMSLILHSSATLHLHVSIKFNFFCMSHLEIFLYVSSSNSVCIPSFHSTYRLLALTC